MTFDPSKHLRSIKGKGGNAEYLDVKWRLVWLREEHPDAATGVEHIEISPDIAIFKATVSIPGGGSATDYGSETPRDFGDFIEKAATKALGRALAQLGYGTQFVGEELSEGVRIVDSPVERTSAPARTPTPPAPQNGVHALPDPMTREEFSTFFTEQARRFLNGTERPYILTSIKEARPRFSPEQYAKSLDWWRAFEQADEPGMAAALAPPAPAAPRHEVS